jgi:hypothetical protein
MGNAFTVFGQDSRMSDHSKEALKGAVEVTISSDRHSYKQHDSIWLTAHVKNVGEIPFFVFPQTSFEDDGDGVFIVRIKEAPKCNSLVTNHAGTPVPPAKDLKFADYVQTSWELLKPGELMQASDLFDKIHPLCPGKYSLTVTYLTELFWWTGDSIHASEAELPFPAVFGAYRGNTVSFRVRTGDYSH